MSGTSSSTVGTKPCGVPAKNQGKAWGARRCAGMALNEALWGGALLRSGDKELCAALMGASHRVGPGHPRPACCAVLCRPAAQQGPACQCQHLTAPQPRSPPPKQPGASAWSPRLSTSQQRYSDAAFLASMKRPHRQPRQIQHAPQRALLVPDPANTASKTTCALLPFPSSSRAACTQHSQHAP
jgi:hypothetical protein